MAVFSKPRKFYSLKDSSVYGYFFLFLVSNVEGYLSLKSSSSLVPDFFFPTAPSTWLIGGQNRAAAFVDLAVAATAAALDADDVDKLAGGVGKMIWHGRSEPWWIERRWLEGVALEGVVDKICTYSLVQSLRSLVR